ncbi:uncharacterized protein [Amphiura filiformis]|uniref:uncharacterized protein n=1 Tax=Amphiura filiformis TaxID=82378 RepID=UPI003B221120
MHQMDVIKCIGNNASGDILLKDYSLVIDTMAIKKEKSAYRQYHSIETALTCVYNDILMDLDKQGGETILVLLDLTAAFDTIDHKVLKSRYGVGGSALNLFSSYLQNRSQSVLVDGVLSHPVEIDYEH